MDRTVAWNEDGSCNKHDANGCPEREWADGRTLHKIFEGQRVWSTVYGSGSEAQSAAENLRKRNEMIIEEYADLRIKAPEQYFKWEYKVL